MDEATAARLGRVRWLSSVTELDTGASSLGERAILLQLDPGPAPPKNRPDFARLRALFGMLRRIRTASQVELLPAMSEFEALLSSTPLAAGNAPYVEAMYERFLADPASVDPRWRDYFTGMGGLGTDVAHGPLIEDLARRALTTRAPAAGGGTASAVGVTGAAKQGAVSRLIQIYANRGHLVADIDPLGLMVRPVPKVLGLDYLGLPSPTSTRSS